MSKWVLTGFGKEGSYEVPTNAETGNVMGGLFFNAMMGFTNRKTNEAIEAILQRLVREAKKLSLPKRTGALSDSITYVMVPEQRWGAFGSDLYYARFVNDGTSTFWPGRHFLEGALATVKVEQLGG